MAASPVSTTLSPPQRTRRAGVRPASLHSRGVCTDPPVGRVLNSRQCPFRPQMPCQVEWPRGRAASPPLLRALEAGSPWSHPGTGRGVTPEWGGGHLQNRGQGSCLQCAPSEGSRRTPDQGSAADPLLSRGTVTGLVSHPLQSLCLAGASASWPPLAPLAPVTRCH